MRQGEATAGRVVGRKPAPTRMASVAKYGAQIKFFHNLIAADAIEVSVDIRLHLSEARDR